MLGGHRCGRSPFGLVPIQAGVDLAVSDAGLSVWVTAVGLGASLGLVTRIGVLGLGARALGLRLAASGRLIWQTVFGHGTGSPAGAGSTPTSRRVTRQHGPS